MLNKIYGWIETSFANRRNDEPAAEDSDGYPAPREALVRRKRPVEWYEACYKMHVKIHHSM